MSAAPAAAAGLPFTDPALRADPYPAFAALREGGPVEVAPGLVAFGRYADVEQVLTHPAGGHDPRRSEAVGALLTAAGPRAAAEEDRYRSFLFLDPPDHTRLRGLVAKAFTRRRVEALRPRVRELVAAEIDELGTDGDVISSLAYPLPVTVISELLGVPPADRATFQGWSRQLAHSLDFGLLPPAPEQRRAQLRARTEFRDYFRALIAERRRAPGDDLLSALVQAEEAGDRLSEDELLATCILLLVAGHETTVNLLGNAVLALLRHPAQWQALAADPGRAAAAVEETLRYDPPVQLTVRIALADLAVGGATVRAGQAALCLLGAANRDPLEFGEPDRFDLDRPDVRPLSFGKGIHFCLGAALARLEGEVALTELARRWQAPVLAEDPPYSDNLVLRGVERLTVRLAGLRR